MQTSFNDLLKRYALFSGRASRTEFWLSSVVLSILLFATGVIDVTGITFDSDDYFGSFEAQVKSTFSNFGLIITIPVLSVTCRRLHDTNRRAWFLLLYFIPFVGSIWLLFLFIRSRFSSCSRVLVKCARSIPIEVSNCC